ncbi:MAG: CesT family type III secretion system chaperone [Deltaproteobacteria bacterium]|nr:CesT family type III secretion system chaperone [Deltaproteobacteria bacterium]
MSRELVNTWLTSMGDFQLDDDGSCVLESENGVVLVVEVPENSEEQLFIYSPVAMIEDDVKPEFLRFVLELNLVLARTGLAFGLDSFSGSLLIFTSHLIRNLNEEVFRALLDNMRIVVEEVDGQIREFISEAGPDSERPDKSLDKQPIIRV